MPLSEMLKQHEANSHYCHQFCSVAGAEPAPGAPSLALPDRVVQESLSRKARFLAWRHVPTETRCKIYQICLRATLFLFLPPHSIREQSAEEGCVRLAHASPGARRSAGRAELTAMLALQTRTPVTFQVPLTATTPVLGTLSPVVGTDRVNQT